MSDWTYVPMNENHKVPMSILASGIKVFEQFSSLCKDLDIRFIPDSEQDVLAFDLDKYTFVFNDIDTNEIHINLGQYRMGTIRKRL